MATLFYSTIRPAQDCLTVWTSTENEVDVRIEVIKRPSGQLSLSGTFTPTRQQFYLYGKDLPRDGLNGLGRPTLLEVLKSDSIKVTGPLTADQPVQYVYVKTLDLSFPVYPIGPVRLSLPFERIGNGSPVSMEISITYMACSDRTCLPPVIDKHISIQAPASFFDDQR
ncbi:MAG TPA: hypothetical protein VHP14_02235 [Anaerolineales bacterium]|nr:hypothetical protein [Anaerolineales bacterium]